MHVKLGIDGKMERFLNLMEEVKSSQYLLGTKESLFIDQGNPLLTPPRLGGPNRFLIQVFLFFILKLQKELTTILFTFTIISFYTFDQILLPKSSFNKRHCNFFKTGYFISGQVFANLKKIKLNITHEQKIIIPNLHQRH